ncbi:MAG: response regulator transcription factor [Thermoleophilia bacterium]|nr:response regulator transcription factor [Thermoleophilia bacterium]
MSDTKGQHILIVEDEENISSFVKLYLEREGFNVTIAPTGAAAISAFEEKVDLVTLDLMLPDMDGLEICRQIRAKSTVPIIMLTARDEDIDKIVGLEVGADDYVTKPFNARELVARIKSILRRANAPVKTSKRLECGHIQIDAARRECLIDGEQVMLAPKEFDLLWELLERNGDVLDREHLLEKVWGYTFAGDTRTVDVHVRQLRKKLGDECPIVTVWGSGYKVGTEVHAA